MSRVALWLVPLLIAPSNAWASVSECDASLVSAPVVSGVEVQEYPSDDAQLKLLRVTARQGAFMHVYFDDNSEADARRYKLRKKTADFDAKLEALFAKHPGNRADLKTSRFINGKGAWNQIDAQERKDFLTEVCALAVANGGKIFGVALSFNAFDEARAACYGHPFGNSYWIAGGLFTSALVQKKMQGVANSKGLTVVIMDDNKAEMANFSDGLYACDGWYDGLYRRRVTKRKKRIWQPRTKKDRFDQIINTAFAIKSDHSSLVQVADAICYV